MDSLWKIALVLLLAYVTAITLAYVSSFIKAAAIKAYHAFAGRNLDDPKMVCEIDTTGDTPEQGLRILVGRASGCTLSSGEVRGQAEAMLEGKDKLTSRIVEMIKSDAPIRVFTFEYPSKLSLLTRGVYLFKAQRVWAATEDGALLSAYGYGTVTKYDGQRRWCVQYLVPKDHATADAQTA